MPRFIHCRWILLVLCGSLGLPMTSLRAADSVAGQVRNVEGNQAKVAAELVGTNAGLQQLLEELLENAGLELTSEDRIRAASAKLGGLSSTLVPEVLEYLRSARLDKVHAGAHLTAALAGSTRLLEDLKALLKTLKEDLSPRQVQQLLLAAIETQTHAFDDVTALCDTHPTLEGKPEGALTPAEKEALSGAGEKQKAVTAALTAALAGLEKLKGLPEARVALAALRTAGLPETSGQAEKDLHENKPRLAQEKQGRILAILTGASGQFGSHADPIGTLERQIAGLRAARTQQEKARAGASDWARKDDEQREGVLHEQGEVARRLAGLNGENWREARRSAGEAQQKLGEDKPGEALDRQDRVLKAMDAGIAAAERALNAAHSAAAVRPPAVSGVEEPPPVAAQNPASAPDSAQHSDVGIQFHYALRAASPAEADWNVVLPPKDRVAVEQAFLAPPPVKYARQIQLYYECLATAGQE